MVYNGSGNVSGRDELVNWIIEKSDCLNVHWQNIIDAEQGGCNPNGSHIYSAQIHQIAGQARVEIQNYRSELARLSVSPELGAVKAKCGTLLDNWDRFFVYMDNYSRSENLDDFGAATRSYKAVDVVMSEILSLLGLAPAQAGQDSVYTESEQQLVNSVKEKEIIRMTKVIVKVKCPYCNGLYDETLDVCPRCGGTR